MVTTLNIALDDEEHKKLERMKHDLNWHDFIMLTGLYREFIDEMKLSVKWEQWYGKKVNDKKEGENAKENKGN